ncbi:MAG: hypothetical protein HDT36_00985 [Clostridiales bacterium]|nr:hypothetical protein [Clostridiales bacterium]
MKRQAAPMNFNFKYHMLGRIWMALGILLFISIPIAIGVHYGVTPDWKVFGTSAVIIPFIINFISGIAEPIIYAPMLGTNSAYLAFLTGNLSNLKIPCVVKAHEIYPTENGSEEREIISTIAVATSTLVTVVIIAILVLCFAVSNLQSVVEKASWIMPAFSCVVYALFGSLGGKYVAKNPKLALIPTAIITVLSIILGVTKIGGSVGSAYLFVGIGICALFALFRYMREKRKIAADEEYKRLAGIGEEAETSEEVKVNSEKVSDNKVSEEVIVNSEEVVDNE